MIRLRYIYKWKKLQCQVHYTFLKSETSARSSSDSPNGSNISVDLWGFLTQARHINRMIYMVTTMISKTVPTQAAACRTNDKLFWVLGYECTGNFFYLGCVDLTVEMMRVRFWAKARYEHISLASREKKGEGRRRYKCTCKLLHLPFNITK